MPSTAHFFTSEEDMTDSLSGGCPICRGTAELTSIDPKYPDDPMLNEVDCFVLSEHTNQQTKQICEGVGKHPSYIVEVTDVDDDGWEDDPPSRDD